MAKHMALHVSFCVDQSVLLSYSVIVRS